jgi:hypothetical protein
LTLARKTYLPTKSCSAIAVAIVLAASLGLLSGCAVTAVADAAVTVTATAVKVGAAAVGAAADVAGAGVRAVTGSSDEKKK